MKNFEILPPHKPSLDFRQAAWRQIVDNVVNYEREKSFEETEIIHDANNKTSLVIESYGVPAASVTPDTVHVIKARNWVDGHAFMSREHGIFVCENKDLEKFRMAVVHEMFHFKGVNHLPVPLTEAIIERLTAQALNLEDMNLAGSQVFSGKYTYPDFRITLDDFLKLIRDNTPAGITTDFHSFSLFAKAHLTGNIGHLEFLNEIFSPDTVEKLQKLDDDPESLNTFVKSL